MKHPSKLNYSYLHLVKYCYTINVINQNHLVCGILSCRMSPEVMMSLSFYCRSKLSPPVKAKPSTPDLWTVPNSCTERGVSGVCTVAPVPLCSGVSVCLSICLSVSHVICFRHFHQLFIFYMIWYFSYHFLTFFQTFTLVAYISIYLFFYLSCCDIFQTFSPVACI